VLSLALTSLAQPAKGLVAQRVNSNTTAAARM
jgi:hypothetical protein